MVYQRQGQQQQQQKLIQTDRPYIFFTCDSKHTYFFFGLIYIFSKLSTTEKI
jgi:hypothetical protein